MRRLLLVALLLLCVPAVVALRQLHEAREEAGTVADYLEIEEPFLPSGDDPVYAEGGVPILCYHYLGSPGTVGHLARVLGAVFLNLPLLGDREYWSLSEGIFEQQMRWLAENGYTSVGLEAVRTHLEGGAALPDRSIALTFDDGDRSVLELALPILRRHGMKATLFVVTSQVGRRWNDLDMMSWEELAILRDSGHFQIESHSHDLHYKVKDAAAGTLPAHVFQVHPSHPDPAAGRIQLLEDLLRSREELRRHLGVEASFLAWPYGFANGEADEIARKAGFRGTLSLEPGANRPGEHAAWHMRRFTITARSTLDVFRRMVEEEEGEALARY